MKKIIFPLISILSIIALIPFSYNLSPIVDSIIFGLIDKNQNIIVNKSNFPDFTTALFISLLFSSPLWVFAIWKLIIPNCKIRLLTAFLGLIFILLGGLFVYYLYIPLFFNFTTSTNNETTALSLNIFRDFTVKSLVSFILLFQIFPVTIHFSKNYSRSFLYSILLRVILLIITLFLASLIAPPDILSQLSIVLSVIIPFELARGIRRYVIIKNGGFHKMVNPVK